MSSSRLYCRFCAEKKFISEFTAKPNHKSVITKLLIFTNKNSFVDFSIKKLPKTVCNACYELIINFVTFFLRVQRAQVVLKGIFEVNDETDLLESFSDTNVKEEYYYDDRDSQDDDLFGKAKDGACEAYSHTETNETVFEDPQLEYGHKTECVATNEDDDLFCKAKDVACEPYSHTETNEAVFEDPQIEYELITECVDSNEGTTNTINLLPFNFELPQLEGPIKSWTDYPMICKFCKVKVSDKDVLGSHCVEVHKKCFGMSCVDCDWEVECFEEFLKHVGGHRPDLRKICPYCNKVINPDSDHVKLEHTANMHPCILCGNIYQYKRNLRAHEAIIDPTPLMTPPKKRRKNPLPPTREDLTCHICGLVMKTKASLKSHLPQHGDKKKNYTCDRCGKTYFLKGNLLAHRLTHENVDRHVCKICSKSFLTLGRLRRHIKTHNFELPFQCDVCKRCFSSKDRIREHCKAHMNIKPFKCKFCPKKFKFSSLIKTHENQHTGARPYKCEFCLMDFANWSNCNKHMKRKHNTSLAKHVMTRYGKLAVDPETGKPNEVNMDHGIKEWTENVLMKKIPKRARSKKKSVIGNS